MHSEATIAQSMDLCFTYIMKKTTFQADAQHLDFTTNSEKEFTAIIIVCVKICVCPVIRGMWIVGYCGQMAFFKGPALKSGRTWRLFWSVTNYVFPV